MALNSWITAYGLKCKIAARYHALRAMGASARLILACVKVLRRLAGMLGMTLAEAVAV